MFLVHQTHSNSSQGFVASSNGISRISFCSIKYIINSQLILVLFQGVSFFSARISMLFLLEYKNNKKNEFLLLHNQNSKNVEKKSLPFRPFYNSFKKRHQCWMFLDVVQNYQSEPRSIGTGRKICTEICS